MPQYTLAELTAISKALDYVSDNLSQMQEQCCWSSNGLGAIVAGPAWVHGVWGPVSWSAGWGCYRGSAHQFRVPSGGTLYLLTLT
ncbi:hypothetical protein CEXT_417081 [Caerostris extrusa]|uniref:Uncharacterized protein n=1 Tax=Caerostris extrusa TaxID=172846 RepID=A0AAV4U354_CAEEX|nr:hypothetical protein CEXT_417081 [Caerostris extrusa]